jgi:hypothetical protein
MIALLMLVCGLAGAGARAQAPAVSKPDPETVMVTYHVREGREAAFAAILDEAWKTMTELSLVADAPHVVLRRDDPKHPTFVEVFTWKDREIPDHAPQALRTIWERMGPLVESLQSQPAIDIVEMRLVTPARP